MADPKESLSEHNDSRPSSDLERQWEESEADLPPGFEWEYREGNDGGGQIGYRDGKPYSESWPSTRYRRAVGAWRVVRRGGRRL